MLVLLPRDTLLDSKRLVFSYTLPIVVSCLFVLSPPTAVRLFLMNVFSSHESREDESDYILLLWTLSSEWSKDGAPKVGYLCFRMPVLAWVRKFTFGTRAASEYILQKFFGAPPFFRLLIVIPMYLGTLVCARL